MKRVDVRDDRGASLLEVVVAMALLSIFMGIFTVSTLMMTQATVKVQSYTEVSQMTNNGFLALERAVRYSTGITQPARDGGIWNVEFAWQDKNAGSLANRCTQLRVTTEVGNQRLQQRSWSVTAAGAAVNGSLTPWRTLASGMTNGAALDTDPNRPFKAPEAGTVASTRQQGLTLTVIAARGVGPSAVTRQSTTNFSASNTGAPGWTSTVCQQYGVNV